MKTLSRSCVVAGAAALLTAFAGTTAAYALDAPLPDEGTLMADGAAVTLSLTFDCETGATADAFVFVSQNVDGAHVATGNGFSSSASCGDGEETVDVAVLTTGHYAFTEGTAAVQVILTSCTTDACEQGFTTGEVRFEDE
jgi:hypothetical protein